MWFCRVDSDTMRITNFYQADGPAQEGDLEFPGEPMGSFYEPVKDTETGVISLVENTQAKLDAAWTALRTERNRRLAASDWTQLVDSHLSQEKKDAWAAYRQELRDLPDEVTDPTQVEWPLDPTQQVPVPPVTGSRLDGILGQV